MKTEIKPIFLQNMPLIELVNDETIDIYQWDIPYTIKELSYLTHSHYRYYGKFPSVIAGKILDLLPPVRDNSYVLDNFCGSGTTLVEAKLRDINSIGIDINWISSVASNTKVRHIDFKKVRELHSFILKEYDNCITSGDFNNYVMSDFEFKWFTRENAISLSIIQNIIKKMTTSFERDFLLIAFLGIVRRVSKAYDAEVRPHINKDKSIREVLPAFSKKINDMIENHTDFMSMTKNSIDSNCLIGNNLQLPNEVKNKDIYLVISHPPYLNSFNYSPVFSLELYWGQPFEKDYVGVSKLYKTELRAHPADEANTEKYFEHLKNCYQQTFNIQKEGDYLAVVIGDCTRKGKLIPVLEITRSIIEEIGYKIISLNYRTTHYGLGKYAYKHRADYHNDSDGKKDGILIFQK